MTTIADPALSPQARADEWLRDAALARAKGNTPEHVAARQRVARLFCQMHFHTDTPAQRDARLAPFDYSMPVVSTNARGIDILSVKAKGFLGLGRKRAFLISERMPPKSDHDPIYALEYSPLKR